MRRGRGFEESQIVEGVLLQWAGIEPFMDLDQADEFEHGKAIC